MDIVLVGCGFLGSLFTEEFLKHCFAGELPRSFRFIDDDAWERRNAANQNVTLRQAMQGIGKAESLAQLAAAYEREAEGRQTRLTERNAAELLGDAWVIVDAVDNLKTRHLLYDVGLGKRIPVLHLGIAHEQGTGTVEWSHPEHDTFALAPQRTIGKTIVDPESGVTPPCELASMRAAGWMTAFAAAVSLSGFFGFDVIHVLPDKERGWLTEWRTTPAGFFPVKETWSRLEE